MSNNELPNSKSKLNARTGPKLIIIGQADEKELWLNLDSQDATILLDMVNAKNQFVKVLYQGNLES